MSSLISDRLYSLDRVRRDRLRRLVRIDPVGPMVAAHAVLLALLGSVQDPTGVLILAGAVLVWRTVFTVVANRGILLRRRDAFVACAVGSLAIVGGMMALDGGTESPLFFSMLIVVVWAAAMNTLKRFLAIGAAALVVYLGVILVVPDITVNSVARFGVYVFFVGMLAWARAVSDYWLQESQATKTLAAEILEAVPTGFLFFESNTLSCLFANPGARDLGLDRPGERKLTRYGHPNGSITLSELLASVATSGESLAPTLYVMSMGEPQQRFLRIAVTHRPMSDEEALVMVSVEDVSGQVAAGEQQRRFFESANHQFRTPLSPIMAYANLIAEGNLTPEELREAGEAIGEGAQRIETLLERINALLRLQRRPNRAFQELTVEEIVEGHLLSAAPHLREVLRLTGTTDLTVRCEPSPLTEAMFELAVNSKQHGEPPITISVESQDDAISIRIFDDGPGPDIDPDAPLDHTWGLLAHPEVMPTQMGDRLGISYAFTLTQTAGGTLDFRRDETTWAFELQFPAASQKTSLSASTVMQSSS
ncbi:MAG: sensor histidine kinase [Actinomycetota bacterium]